MFNVGGYKIYKLGEKKEIYRLNIEEFCYKDNYDIGKIDLENVLQLKSGWEITGHELLSSRLEDNLLLVNVQNASPIVIKSCKDNTEAVKSISEKKYKELYNDYCNNSINVDNIYRLFEEKPNVKVKER